MGYLQYYDGLNKRELVNDNPWLIVIKEAAEYCKSRDVDYIRFNSLKERSNEALSWLTGGSRYSLGGTFESIVYSHRCKRYLHVVKVGPKETRIYPNISLTDKEFEARRAENLKPGNKRLATLVSGLDQVQRSRPIFEPKIPITDGLGGVVVYADKRKGIKII
jgi:hypothetical protein